MIAHRVAMFPGKCRGLMTTTNVIRVLVPTVPRPILMRVVIIDRSCRRGNTTLRPCIPSVGLVDLGEHVFALPDLRRVLHTVGLLYKKHAAMILRSLHDFWSRPPILVVNVEVLVRLRALRPVRIVVLASLLLRYLLILWLGSSICCPKASEARTIHLLL